MTESLEKLPGKPAACNFGLLSMNYGLLWGRVACYFGQLSFPGLMSNPLTRSNLPLLRSAGLRLPTLRLQG